MLVRLPIKRIQLWTLCSFLIGLFPILAIYSQNVGYTPLRHLVAPVAIVLAGTVLGGLLLYVVMRDAHKASVLLAFGMSLFFSFGLVHGVIFEWTLLGFVIGRGRFILALYALLFGVVSVLVWRTRRDVRPLVQALGVLSLSLLVVSVLFTGAAWVIQVSARPAADPEPIRFPATPPETLPDIYFIILDAYGRSDVLRTAFGFDNRAFLEDLEKQGFQVADRGTSNYPFTMASIGCTLNMRYLDTLLPGISPDMESYDPLIDLVQNSRVVEILTQQFGYKLVAFETGWSGLELRNADVYFEATGTLTDFDNAILTLTPMEVLIPRISEHEQRRRQVVSILNKLPEVPAIEGPTFTIAHVPAPHTPFVFGKDGEELPPEARDYEANLSHFDESYEATADYEEWYGKGYRKQAAYISQRIGSVVTEILRRSPEPPLIILQGDHGPHTFYYLDRGRRQSLEPREQSVQNWGRLSILSAWHLPGPARENWTPNLSAVNTFRFVLMEYLGADLDLLPDRWYWAEQYRPYEFFRLEEFGSLENAPGGGVD